MTSSFNNQTFPNCEEKFWKPRVVWDMFGHWRGKQNLHIPHFCKKNTLFSPNLTKLYDLLHSHIRYVHWVCPCPFGYVHFCLFQTRTNISGSCFCWGPSLWYFEDVSLKTNLESMQTSPTSKRPLSVIFSTLPFKVFLCLLILLFLIFLLVENIFVFFISHFKFLYYVLLLVCYLLFLILLSALLGFT